MSTDRTHSTYSEKMTIWGHLGYAIMKCQVLEHRLADVLFMCEMLNGKYTCQDMKRYVPKYQAQTMGWLRNRIRETTALPEVLDDKLNEVCDIRNELAHRYFKSRMELLHTREGYSKLAEELDGMYRKIEEVISEFHGISSNLGKPLGYSTADINRAKREISEYLSALPDSEREKMQEEIARHTERTVST